MNIVFKEGRKRLALSISGYEFSLKKDIDWYDANWLVVQVDYSDDDGEKTYTAPCLLTNELESLKDDIGDILQGEETGMITDFLEPSLKLSITRVDEFYAVQIRFVYEMSESGWKEVYVSQGMDKQGLQNLRDSFQALSNEYPVRETKNKEE